MSDERKDLGKAFLAVFDAEDKALFKLQEKKAKNSFIKNALYEYHLTKSWTERNQKDGVRFVYSVTDEFAAIVRAINNLNVSLQTSKEPTRTASLLGGVLGKVLGIVRFGLTNHLFNPLTEVSGISSGERVLTAIDKIVTEMRRMDKKIKPQFIARQVSSIAKEHAGKLTKEQQELLTKVAAMFASI